MAVIHVLGYFIIAFIFDANIICGSVVKNYLRSNAPISLLDLLQVNDVDLKRIDSNEAEELVKSIVKQNRINNDKLKIIPLNRIIPPEYELEREKINEGILKNYGIEDLLADLLSDYSEIDRLIPQDYGFRQKNDRKSKNSLHRAIPPDYELVKNRDIPPDYELIRQEKLQGLIPLDYELVKNIPPDHNSRNKRNIPPDYELVTHGKLKGLIPPDYELITNRDIPPDYELKIKGLIPADYELIRQGKLHGLIPPDYELIKNRNIPPDYEYVREGKIKSLIPPDYELVRNRDIPPDYELKIKGLVAPDYELVKNRDIPPDYELIGRGELQRLIPPDYELSNRDVSSECELITNGLGLPPDHELLRKTKYKTRYYCKLARDGKIKRLLPSDYDLVDIDSIPRIYLKGSSSNDISELIKILVKSLVPSHYELPQKNNAYFKFLTRLPNRHPINDESDHDLILVRSPNDEDLLAKFGLFDQRYLHKKKEYPKQYKPLTPKEEKTALNLVKHIKYLVTQTNSPLLKKLAMDRILDVLNKMENLRQGEGEGNGEVEPQKTVNPAPLSAYVPFFNYWTYQKTIVEDDCPEDSVKIGNVCSRTPPH